MNSIFIVLEKILFLILLITGGMVIKKFNLISDKGVDEVSNTVVDFFWPVMIFYQITSALDGSMILKNFSLPLFAILTGVTGFLLGLLTVKIFNFSNGKKQIFLYNATVNNFLFMAIPFVETYFPGNGLGFLFIHNIGFIIIIWTLGVFVFQEKYDFKKSLKGLINPGLISTALAIIITLTGISKFIPKIIMETLKTLGTPMLALAMIVTGAKIYILGKNALKIDLWNILLGFVRLILIPALFLVLTLILKKYTNISKEVLGIFMIVNIMPVSVISVSMAIRYDSDVNLASQGVLSNHIFSIITIPVFMIIIEKLVF